MHLSRAVSYKVKHPGSCDHSKGVWSDEERGRKREEEWEEVRKEERGEEEGGEYHVERGEMLPTHVYTYVSLTLDCLHLFYLFKEIIV